MEEKLLSPKGTELLCKNIVETTFENLTEENVELLKDRVLDMVGCILGGSVVKENETFFARIMEWGGIPEAPVFTSGGKRLPLPNAVMINAIKARSNDFGSMLFKVHGDAMPSHLGETLIPMGLTLADALEVSGKDFMTHDVAAEDLMGRLLYTLPVRFPVDMLLVASSAAALAGRYYCLDVEGMKTALSFAATNATNPANAYFDYSEEFKYHNGQSAQTGIFSAEMARAGWRGLIDPYYGQDGLIANRVKDGNYPENYEKIFEDLGKVWYTECAFKVAPGGIPMTAVAYAAKDLHGQILEKRGRVDGTEMKAVHVYGSEKIYHGYYAAPFVLRNQINGLFSYRFAAACGVLTGGMSVADVQTEAILKDADLLRLSEEATMETYEPADHMPKMKVEVEMKDGSVFSSEMSFFMMDQRPSREDLIVKFRSQSDAYGKLPAANLDKIIELSAKLDQLENMKEFTQLFVE